MVPRKLKFFRLNSQLTGPTMSDTWLTVVPEAAPRYMTLLPGLMWISATPPKMAAASLDLKGFHDLYSFLISPSCNTIWTNNFDKG